MTTSITGMAGRFAAALLLILLATGSVLAAVATLPGPATAQLAEETSEPSESPSAEPSEAPSAEPSASPEEPEAIRKADDDDDDDDDGTPSPANLERIAARLAAQGVATTTEELAALATKVGVGGAVRVVLFADAGGTTPEEILAKFESGTGWGVIAKELGTHPGLGSVMGNGKGLDKAAKAAEKAERARLRAERKADRAAGSGD